jgi:hypothetical protein
MNNERYNQIIDDAYENALLQYGFQWLPATQAGTSLESKESFIVRIKTDKEFSERFGLNIEERELSRQERYEHLRTHKYSGKWDGIGDDMEYYNSINVPTKLITVTYNDETIEIYE